MNKKTPQFSSRNPTNCVGCSFHYTKIGTCRIKKNNQESDAGEEWKSIEHTEHRLSLPLHPRKPNARIQEKNPRITRETPEKVAGRSPKETCKQPRGCLQIQGENNKSGAFLSRLFFHPMFRRQGIRGGMQTEPGFGTKEREMKWNSGTLETAPFWREIESAAFGTV